MTQTTAHDTVSKILADKPDLYRPMTPGRYPFTYAYDFFRQHSTEFGGNGELLSRGEAGRAIRAYVAETGQNLQDVIVVLADGYLAENDVIATQEEKDAAMAIARATTWTSLGLPAPEKA